MKCIDKKYLNRKHIGIIMSVFLVGAGLTGCGNPSEKGVECLENGRYEEAIEYFEKAVEDEVNIGDAYRGIGIAKWEQEDYEGAGEAFRNALENGAQKTGTLYNFIGNCELRLGNAVSAQNHFQVGIEQEGNSAELNQEMKYNLIVALEQAGDWENARARLGEYIAEYPEDAAAQKEVQFLETR